MDFYFCFPNHSFRFRFATVFVIAICSLLVGCSAPSATYRNLVLTAPTPGSSGKPFELRELPAAGAIHLVATPQESAGNAAAIELQFSQSLYQSPLTIQMSDNGCTGHYNLSVEYAAGPKRSTVLYPRTHPAWGLPLTIDIRWQGNTDYSIQINGDESLTFTIAMPARALNVTVSSGALLVDTLEFINRR